MQTKRKRSEYSQKRPAFTTLVVERNEKESRKKTFFMFGDIEICFLSEHSYHLPQFRQKVEKLFNLSTEGESAVKIGFWYKRNSFSYFTFKNNIVYFNYGTVRYKDFDPVLNKGNLYLYDRGLRVYKHISVKKFQSLYKNIPEGFGKKIYRIQLLDRNGDVIKSIYIPREGTTYSEKFRRKIIRSLKVLIDTTIIENEQNHVNQKRV